MSAWTFADIPDQTGRVAIVTGSNTGIGYEAARMLALKNAEVVLACRNVEKGESALARIRAERADAKVQLRELDLSSLASVRSFASQFAAEHDHLDLLVNNAGVMVPPLGRTKEGFELQFGTNHLGHFALTARLLPLVQKAQERSADGAARVVVVSSTMQRAGRIDFDDLNWNKRSYNAWGAYGQSKLANMMFTLELQRRLDAAGSKVRSTAAHPGYTATDLQRTSAARMFNPFAMKAPDGAMPTLRAAVDPTAPGGSYWGPSRFFELNGPPAAAAISSRAKDEEVARKLFDVSEELTGERFDLVALQRAS